MTNTNQITASFHRLGCGVAWYSFSCRWITVSNSVCYRTTRKSSGGGVNMYVWSLFLLFWKGNQDLDASSFHQPRQRSQIVKHIPIYLHTRLRFRDDPLVVAVVADNPAETCFKGVLDTSNITQIIQRHPLWEVCISPDPRHTHTHTYINTHAPYGLVYIPTKTIITISWSPPCPGGADRQTDRQILSICRRYSICLWVLPLSPLDGAVCHSQSFNFWLVYLLQTSSNMNMYAVNNPGIPGCPPGLEYLTQVKYEIKYKELFTMFIILSLLPE